MSASVGGLPASRAAAARAVRIALIATFHAAKASAFEGSKALWTLDIAALLVGGLSLA